jgi:hypothetical protein
MQFIVRIVGSFVTGGIISHGSNGLLDPGGIGLSLVKLYHQLFGFGIPVGKGGTGFFSGRFYFFLAHTALAGYGKAGFFLGLGKGKLGKKEEKKGEYKDFNCFHDD